MGRTLQLPSLERVLPQAAGALEYATAAHAGQTRAVDGAPFIQHPIEVATLLYAAGAPDHLIAAGLLHDVIEKAGATASDLRQQFGRPKAGLVAAVSEDESIPDYTARKAALRRQVGRAGSEALMLFAADKIARLGELRSAPSVEPRRIEHLRLCA